MTPLRALLLLHLLLLPRAVTAQPYFAVARDAATGAWWLQRDGANFFYRGVTSVNRGGEREGATGPYYNVTLQRYGAAPGAFASAVWQRLRDWRFSALGAWSTPEFWSDAPDALPYTVDIEATFAAPAAVRITGTNMPDVFDPAWLAYLDGRAAAAAAATAAAPRNLVGYFTDNELSWPTLCSAFRCPPATAQPKALAEQGLGLLQQCLSLDAARPAAGAAWAFALARHGGSLAALSAAWQLPTPLASRADLRALYTAQNLTIDSPGLREDEDAWLGPGGYGGAYFNATAAAVRRHDARHLLLGCKFGAPVSDAVYAANAAGHDVVSLDNYRYDMAARVRAAGRGGSAPVLVAEFSWEGSGCPVAPGADELGCCTPGAPPAEGGFACAVPLETPANNLTNLERMYCNGGASLVAALAEKSCVGWTWYRWVDEGSEAASPFTQLGLVDLRDRAKSLAVAVLAPLNAAAEGVHAAGGLGRNATGTWLDFCPFY